MQLADLWSHHRAVLLVLSMLGGVAQLWILSCELRVRGEFAADLDDTIRELIRRGWVSFRDSDAKERHVALSAAGRRLILAVRAAALTHRR
ncbi:MAG: hypothetical protein ACRERC_09490 [Candidatus Binatia bacterium]